MYVVFSREQRGHFSEGRHPCRIASPADDAGNRGTPLVPADDAVRSRHRGHFRPLLVTYFRICRSLPWRFLSRSVLCCISYSQFEVVRSENLK